MSVGGKQLPRWRKNARQPPLLYTIGMSPPPMSSRPERSGKPGPTRGAASQSVRLVVDKGQTHRSANEWAPGLTLFARGDTETKLLCFSIVIPARAGSQESVRLAAGSAGSRRPGSLVSLRSPGMTGEGYVSSLRMDLPCLQRETTRVAILQDRPFYPALETCRTNSTGAQK